VVAAEGLQCALVLSIAAGGSRPDGSGDVEVLEAFWSNERLGLSGTTVPIPLLIADMLASLDSRNIEAARKLHGSWINNFNLSCR
jgi:hypothetical protein